MNTNPRMLAPRLLGLLTAGYAAAVAARPDWLARPCALTEPDGTLSTATRVLTRALAGRDLASGLAMATAPGRDAMITAIGIRVACDAADAVGFGAALPDRTARRNAALAATSWGLLCATSALALRKTSR